MSKEIKQLTKAGIVALLQKRGYSLKNVNELNKLLVEMGFQKQNGRYWMTTKEGIPYTIFSNSVANVNAWLPEIVDAICKYLRHK